MRGGSFDGAHARAVGLDQDKIHIGSGQQGGGQRRVNAEGLIPFNLADDEAAAVGFEQLVEPRQVSGVFDSWGQSHLSGEDARGRRHNDATGQHRGQGEHQARLATASDKSDEVAGRLTA